MGFWKHQQEILRGGDPQACAGRAGCADCFEEGGLKDFVAANAHYQRRDICGASARSEIGADLFDVIEHMNECLDPYYSTAEEKLPYESAEGRRIRTPRESRASCDRHLSHRGSKMDAVRRRTRQLDLDLRSPLRWGGRRTGAGRKPGPRARDAHRKRPPLAARFPCHVTLKVRRDLPSLRNVRLVREVEQSLRIACERGYFRVVHYSLQPDHLPLIVEATSQRDLAAGMKSVGARLARAVNRVFRRRGPVLLDRYHLHVLRTPREVRRAIAYVLLNARASREARQETRSRFARRSRILGPLVRWLAERD